MTTSTSILSKLTELIEKNKAYIIDGSLNRNLLATDARKYDPELLNLLQKDKVLKEHFFTTTDGGLVFKKDVFLQFIMNKEFLPDSYTKYKIKIGLGAEDGSLLSEGGDVVLNWPYKDAILEGGQDKEDQKRSEVFFNEVLASDQITRLLDDKVFTNWKRYDKDGEHDLDELKDNDNLIIKGNNLLVLHSLKKRYAGRVKLIYIDPPYNTGSDSFGYNDSFNHSTWLTFMRNRLNLAKGLLRDDGIIYVQIDDKEHAYLKVLMDEIFGRENYLANIVVKTKTPSGVGQESYIFTITENIIVHAKKRSNILGNNYKIFDELLDENSKTSKNYNMKIDSFGIEESTYSLETGNGRPIKVVKLKDFKFSRTTPKECTKTWYFDNYEKIFRLSPANGGLMKKITPQLPKDPCYIEYIPSKGKYANKKTKIYFINRDMVVFISESSEKDNVKREVNKLVNIHNSWTDDSLWQGIAREGGVSLKNGKKPEQLIKRIIDISTETGDIVLDYHLGSGTTAAVAHKMRRQYIGIEQLYYGENDPIKRLQNVISGDQSGISKGIEWQGGGSFVYANIMNNSNKFRKRVEVAKNDADYLQLLKEATTSSFLSYRVDPKKLSEDEFKKLSAAEKRRLLLELIDNNTLFVNYEDINDPIFKVSEKDKEFNKNFYEKK